jgi:hypothetical protein
MQEGRDHALVRAGLVAVGQAHAEQARVEVVGGVEVGHQQRHMAGAQHLRRARLGAHRAVDAHRRAGQVTLHRRAHRQRLDRRLTVNHVDPQACRIGERDALAAARFAAVLDARAGLCREPLQIVRAAGEQSKAERRCRPALRYVHERRRAVRAHVQRLFAASRALQAEVEQAALHRVEVRRLVAHVGKAAYRNHRMVLMWRVVRRRRRGRRR